MDHLIAGVYLHCDEVLVWCTVQHLAPLCDVSLCRYSRISSVLHSTAFDFIVMICTELEVLYRTTLCCTVPFDTALRYSYLHCISFCMTKHCTIRYYTVLQFIALHFTAYHRMRMHNTDRISITSLSTLRVSVK
jgi:hypothetical protein